MFVRAKFDFEATDPSALSFSQGDVIEVYTKLESGWWDGMLGETRGWFPSNFVEVIEPSRGLGPSGPLPPLPTSTSGNGSRGGSQEVLQGQEGGGYGALDPQGHGRTHSGYDREGQGGEDETGDNIGWADVMGRQGWQDGDLDDLARQVMQGAGADSDDLNTNDEDDDNDFETIAANQRRRQIPNTDRAYEAAMQDLGPEEMDEFGVRPRGNRKREDTERTIMLKPSPMSPGDSQKESKVDGEEEEVEKDGEVSNRDVEEKGNEESAWIPTLTPGGQVSGPRARWWMLADNRCITTIR